MHLDPFCQAASEWKAANKSGDLFSEIRWLAALNRHIALRWEHQNPDLPLDRQIRIDTAIQYDWNKYVTLETAYRYLDAGETEIDQDGGSLPSPLKGEYDTNAIHFFAVNLIWMF